jgi:hypothetical protein
MGRASNLRILHALGAILFAFAGISSAVAECFLLGRDPSGREFYQCDSISNQLPVCGSEFDRGNRCVVVRPLRPLVSGNPSQRQGYVSQRGQAFTGNTPRNPGGDPPFNAGGSWPNRAHEYAHGK